MKYTLSRLLLEAKRSLHFTAGRLNLNMIPLKGNIRIDDKIRLIMKAILQMVSREIVSGKIRH